MQVNVIEGTDQYIMNSLLMGEQSESTTNWIHERFSRTRDYLTDAGQQFVNKIRTSYEQMYDPETIRKARAVIRNIKGVFNPNAVTYLSTVKAIQEAKPVMQRYLMANPCIRSLYHKQLCNGFSDSYVDHEPGKIGEAHYDYRRVMANIVQETETKDEETGEVNHSWSVVSYAEDLVEGDRNLHIDEQMDIVSCWQLMKMAIDLKRDPTDILDEPLSD